MIIPLPLVVSLLLAISYATEYDYKLDWSRCGQDTACYIRKSCLKNQDTEVNKKLLDDLVETAQMTTPMTCDLVMQIKALSGANFLVVIELTGTDFKFSEGIKIMHGGSEPVVWCKDSSAPTVVPELTAEPLKLNPNTFEISKMSCSFLLKAATGTIAKIFEAKPKTEFPTLEYTLNTNDDVIKVEYKTMDAPVTDDETEPEEKNQFWIKPKEHMKCVGDKVKLGVSNEYELTEVDPSKSSIKCGDGTVQILVEYEDKKDTVNEITCVGSTWHWSGKEEVTVKKFKSFTAGCVVKKYCTSCTTLPAEVAETECPKDECKKPTEEKVDGCTVLKCEDNSYTMDGKINQKIEKPVSCKKKEGENTATWFIHDTSTPKEVPTVSCRKIKDCAKDDLKGPPDPCPDAFPECTPFTVDQTHFNVTCNVGDLHYEGGPQAPVMCNRVTGEWSPPNLPELFCAIVKPEEKKEKPSTGGSGAIIGAVFGIFVAIGIVGAVCYYFLVVKKKQNNTKQAGSSTKGKSSTGQSKEAKSKSSGDSNKKKDSASDNNKDSEKPKDGAAAAGDPKKPESTPATPSAAPTATPPPDAAKPAAAAPPKSDPAAPEGTTAI